MQFTRHDPDRDRGIAAGEAARARGATALEAALTAIATGFDAQAAKRGRAHRLRDFVQRCRERAVREPDPIIAAGNEAAANEVEGRLADWLSMEAAA